MRILFTGGGTGGHVLPNIAVIHELKKTGAHDISYIGTPYSVEQRLVQAEGVPFFGIQSGKLRRYFSWQNIIDAFKLPLGVAQAYAHIRRLRPQLVFAKGGSVSVPVALAARLAGVPVWVHEADLSPSLTTSIIARFAEKIWLSFEESRAYFPKAKTEVAGNPIRSEMTRGDADKGYAFTGFSRDFPVLLVMGGSLGAQIINQMIVMLLPELLEDMQIIHITGEHSQTHTSEPLEGLLAKRYREFPFLGSELADMYAITDIALSRAGSGSLFELLGNHIPMLLVPLPETASRGDQIENAGNFSARGFARVLPQESLTPILLKTAVRRLMFDEQGREEMVMQQKKAHLTHGAKRIAQSMVPQKS